MALTNPEAFHSPPFISVRRSNALPRSPTNGSHTPLPVILFARTRINHPIMKFLAASVALLASVEASDKKALLRNAVRLAKEGRTLEQNQQFQITGDYSVQFDSCISLTVDNDEIKEADEYGNSLMTYIQQGSMVAQKSFVTFNVCPTSMCGYEANNAQYIIEAGQYVAITSTVDIKNHERYCEGCREAQDYCL